MGSKGRIHVIANGREVNGGSQSKLHFLSSEGRGDRAVVKEECGIKENLDNFFFRWKQILYLYLHVGSLSEIGQWGERLEEQKSEIN